MHDLKPVWRWVDGVVRIGAEDDHIVEVLRPPVPIMASVRGWTKGRGHHPADLRRVGIHSIDMLPVGSACMENLLARNDEKTGDEGRPLDHGER